MTKITDSKWWQKDPFPRWWQKDYGRITRREVLIHIIFSFNFMLAISMPSYVRASLL